MISLLKSNRDFMDAIHDSLESVRNLLSRMRMNNIYDMIINNHMIAAYSGTDESLIPGATGLSLLLLY